MAAETAVLILTCNQREYVLACLESLESDRSGDFEVAVMDNGSADGTPEAVRARFPDVTLIENGGNLGFSAGNNRGLAWAADRGHRYAFLLNDDTVVEPGCVGRLVETLAAEPHAAAVGPLIEYVEPAGTVAALGGEIHWNRVEARQGWCGRSISDVPRQPFETEFLTAAAVMVRMEAVRRVGTLPEPYFYAMEDAAWSVRFRRAGYTLLAEPRVRVRHHESITTGATSPLKAYYMSRNALLFLKLEGGEVGLLGPLIGYHIKVAKLTLKWLAQGEIRRLGAFWRGYVDFLRGKTGRR